MYNKKVLSNAMKNLDSAKAPAKKKDTIINNKLLPFISNEGYKQGPPPAGTHYRILGDGDTTSIYNPTPYPLNLVGPNGTQAQIGPWDTNTQNFNEPYIDESIAAYGGDISIPDLSQYEDGGEYDLTDDEIAQLKAGGYIIEELPKAQVGEPMQEKNLPAVTVTPAGYKGPGVLDIPFGLFPPKTAAQVQKEELAKGKGPTRETAQKVDQAAKQRAKWERQEAARKKAEETRRLKQEAGKATPASTTFVSTNIPKIEKSTPVEELNKRDQYLQNLIDRGDAAEAFGDLYYDHTSGDASLKDIMKIYDYVDSDGVNELDKYIEGAKYNIWKRQEEKAYQNALWYDKMLNETQAFMADPPLQVQKAFTGKRSFMGQGLRSLNPEDFEDTRFYDYGNDRGIPGTMASEVLKMVNPMYYGAKAGTDLNKGNYINAAGNIVQGLLAGAGSGVTKSKNLKKLFDTQMAVESVQGIPETINYWQEDDLPWWAKSGLTLMDLYFLKQGIGTLKPRLQHYAGALRKKGGMVDMPKKKGSKSYSRSLLATNQLFAQSPLLKKPKFKKRKVFDPNAKYYQEGGITYNNLPATYQSALQKAQEGKYIVNAAQPIVDAVKYDYPKSIPNKDLTEVKVTGQLLDVYKFEKEFEKSHPWGTFRDKRKKKYIRQTSSGLNKLLGVSEKNFPEQALNRIKNVYEEKKSNYVIEKIFEKNKLNLNKREEWADRYNKAIENPDLKGHEVRELQHLLNSKYSFKLQPSTWAKFFSGLQQTVNIALPKRYELDLDIPGYTKAEEEAAKESFMEPLNVITEPTAFVGAAFNNYLTNQAASAGTEATYTPSFWSGEIEGQALPGTANLLNPFAYASALPSTMALGAIGKLKPISAAMKAAPAAVKALSNIPKLGRAASYLQKPAALSSEYAKYMPSVSEIINLDMIKEGVLMLPETLGKTVDYAYGANNVTGGDLAFQVADNMSDFIGVKSAYQWSKPFARKLTQILDTPIEGLTLNNIKNQTIKTFVPEYQAPLIDRLNIRVKTRPDGSRFITAEEAQGATLAELFRTSTATKAMLGAYATVEAYKKITDDASKAKTAEQRSEAAKKIITQVSNDFTNVLATTSVLAPNTLLGRKALNAYNSKYATAYYAVDNANKLRKQDAEGTRIINNIARLVQTLSTRKDGGDFVEDSIDDKTRAMLESLGYIVEDLD